MSTEERLMEQLKKEAARYRALRDFAASDGEVDDLLREAVAVMVYNCQGLPLPEDGDTFEQMLDAVVGYEPQREGRDQG